MEFILQHITEIVAVATTIGAYFFGKRKLNAEAKTAEAGAVESMQKVYNSFVEDVDQKFKAINLELEAVKKEVDHWKNQYYRLKNEFRNYKKRHN